MTGLPLRAAASLVERIAGRLRPIPLRLVVGVAIASMACFPLAAMAATYDIATDFSASSNPTGVWSYGVTATLGGSFSPYTFHSSSGGLDYWGQSSTFLAAPEVFHNSTSQVVIYGSVTLQPGQVAMHPGPQNEISVIRFITPAAGTYRLDSSFIGIDITSTDVSLLLNGTTLWSSTINGYGNRKSYASDIVLAAADRLDFAVGYGPNSTYFNDSTGVTGTITNRVATSLTWNTSSGTWNATSTNWASTANGSSIFVDGDSATFSNASGGTIALSGSMQPSAVAVTAGSGTYAFTSSAGNLIAGSGALTKSGAGVLVLSGSNDYSGGTTLSAGTLRAGHDGVLGSGTLALGGGTFATADASSRSFANAVSVTGDTTIGDATGTGTVTFSGAVGLGGGTRTLTTASNVTVSGALSNGGLTKAGAGTLTLTGSNTYSGGTTISSGTLAVGAGGTSGSIAGNVSVASGARLAFNRSDALAWSGTTSGAGGLVKLGTGTLSLTGSHGYTGPTTVQAGTLALDGTLSSSAVTVQAGGTLQGNAFLGSSLSVSGTLSPGNSPGTVTAGSLSLQAGSTTLMEIAGGGTAGTDYDTIVVTGSSGPAYGGDLSIVFSGTNPFANGTTFGLFQFTGTTSGSFASINTVGSGIYAGLALSPNPDGSWYSPDTAGHQFLRFSPLTGNLVVVPEPSTWLMAIAAIAFAVGHARTRRPT